MSTPDIAKILKELSEKMDRYEKHREELKKDVKAVSDRQSEIVTLLAGSDMNGKKGIISLIEEVDKRTKFIETENKLIQKDLDNIKFWGRGASGLMFAILLVIINAVKEKL